MKYLYYTEPDEDSPKTEQLFSPTNRPLSSAYLHKALKSEKGIFEKVILIASKAKIK